MTTAPPSGGPFVARAEPPWALITAAVMASPRPVPAVPSSRPLAASARVKRSKAPGSNRSGKPRPSSATSSSAPVHAEVGDRQPDPRPGMAPGVGHEVGEDLVEPVGVGVDQHIVARDAPTPAGPTARRRRRPGGAGSAACLRSGSSPRSRRASTSRSLASRVRRSVSLRGRLHRGSGAVDRLRVVAGEVELGQLQLSPQHRQRRAQLVAGVVDERALPLDRPLHPVKQCVERAGERGHLTVGRGHR